MRLLAAVTLCGACVAGTFSEAQSNDPWTGSTGITETVAQIMKRPEQIGMGAGNGDEEFRDGRLRQNRPNLPQDPSAPAAAAPAPPKTSGPLLPQTAGPSFPGAVLSESGFIPPDSMGDVGPSQVLVCVNGRIKVFDRSGILGALNTTTDSFFNTVRNNKGTSDPRVRYDRLSQRWFVIMINTAKTNNRVMLAVSSGSTITNESSFTFFQFQQNTVATAGDTGLFADYPTLGIDVNALYIGCNMFNATSFISTTGFVVRKSSILGAGPIIATAFRQLGTGSASGPYTPQGVDNDDPAATEGYFIGTDTISFGSLKMRRVSTPGTTPTISATITVSGVGSTVNPMGGVPNLGGTHTLDDLDDRLYSAKIKTYRDGVTTRTTLVCAHNIEVDASGVASSSGNRDGSRWYEIENLSGSPSVRQSGTLFDPAAANPDSYWIPSLAVSGQGHLALGCTVAGANRHAEIAVAGRLRTDALNTLQAPSTVQPSSTNYNVQTSSPQRWGDYSHTLVDPNDNMTLWTVQEYCNANNSWGVRVIPLNAPPPATPSSAGSTSVGLASTIVVVTGTSVSGSEFYDPGSAFPNRISASVTGGVVVNGITYDSPTQVTLDLNTIRATAGVQNITITNPDGQSATGTGILTLTPNTAPSCVVSSTTSVSNSSSISFTITFSRNVTGFILSDPVVTNGTKTLLSGSGAAYTLQVTATAEGPVTCQVPAGAALAGDDGTPSNASNTLTVTYDATAPLVPAAPTLTPGSDSGPSNSDRITNVTTPTLSGTSEPGATVKLFAGAGQVGSTVANAVTGAYSVTSSALGDGVHSFKVTATDSAGNASALSPGTSVTIDTAMPTTPPAPTLAPGSDSGSSNSDGLTNVTTPTFTGTTEPGAAVTLFADGAPAGTATANGVGAYSITSSLLGAGTYGFTVSATDLAGNVSAVSAGTTVIIDTGVPPIPSAPVLTAASDSGTSNTDRITNVTLPTFGGTAEANSTVTLFAGVSLVGTTTANGAGAYSVTVSAPVGDGTYVFTVKATDPAGNTSASSGGTSVTIDTVIAVPAAPALIPASDSGSSSSDGITKVTTPTFTGTTEPGATVTLFEGVTVLGSSIADGGGNWNISSSTLSEGVHTAYVKAVDLAGNASASSPTSQMTIDTTPPATPSAPDLASASDTGVSNADNLTSLTTPSFTGTANPGVVVKLFANGIQVGSATATAGGLYTVTASALADGTYSFTTTATDVAGNASAASAGLSVTIDAAPPAAPSVPDLDAASDTGASNIDNITSLTTLSFSGTAEAGSTVQLFVDGVAGATTTATGGNWTIVASSLSQGVHSITARATDLAGNLGSPSGALSVTVDAAPPAAPSTPDLAPASDTGVSNSDNLTKLTTLSFTGTAEAGSTVQLFVDGVAGATTTATGGNWTIVASSLSQGVHSITARATDLAGNLGSPSGALSVTIDTSAPASPSTPDLNPASDSGASNTDNLTNLTTLSFSGSAEAGSTVQLFVDGVAGATTTATGGSWTIVASSLTEGVHSVTAVSTDAAGNASLASGALPVTVDLTPPATPPAPDLDAASDSGASSSDNVTKLTTLSFSGTAEAGSTVRLLVDGTQVALATIAGTSWTLSAPGVSEGAHSITATATDAAGNASVASAPLTVTVDLTSPAPPSVPDLDAASDSGTSNTDNVTSLTTLSFSGTAEAGATVQLFVDGVAGNAVTAAAGSWTISASSLSPGSHSITARATDAAGNSSAASGPLTVTIDTTLPSAPSVPDLDAASDTGTSAIDNLTKLTTLSFSGTAEAGATVRLFVDGVSAGTTVATGGTWTIVASSLSPGVHSITATVLDPAGNLSAASGPLSVTIDSTPPIAPPAPTLDAASDNGPSSTDGITKIRTLSVSGTAEPGASIQLFADATPVGTPVVAAVGGSYTVVSSSLADGAYSLTVTATDAAGNVSPPSAALAVVVDNTDPPVGIVQDGPGADVSVQNSATTIVANWSGFVDPLSGILKYEMAIGTTPGGVQVEDFVDVGTATSASRGALPLVEGTTYYVTVRATNLVGLQSVGTSDGVKIDLTAPAPPGSLTAVPGNQSAVLLWTTSPSADTAFYRLWWKLASASWSAATLVDNLSGTSTTVGGLVNGSLYDFRLRAVDAAGNESTDQVASTTPQPSIQIDGGASFGTIQEALDAAGPGQTVLVGPGTYPGDIVLHPGESLEGYSPTYTILQGSGLGPVITVEGTFGSGLTSTISQLTVTGGLVGISTASADLTIRNVVIHHVLGNGVSAGVASRLAVINLTAVSNTGDGIRALGTTSVRNTISGENGGIGLNVPGAASVRYNDAWANTGGDYTVAAGVSGNLSAAALFTNEAAFNYTTPASSPTVDAGDPADDFSNEPLPNGGRIDQGAYGNTTSAPPSKSPGHGGGGGGCGLLGIDGLALVALLLLRRRK